MRERSQLDQAGTEGKRVGFCENKGRTSCLVRKRGATFGTRGKKKSVGASDESENGDKKKNENST